MEIDIGKLKDKRNPKKREYYTQRRPFRGGYRNRRGDYRNQDRSQERYRDKNKKEVYVSHQKSQDQKDQSTNDGRNKSEIVNLNGKSFHLRARWKQVSKSTEIKP